MDVRSLVDAKRFDPQKVVKSPLFESARLTCDVHCLSPGQEQKAHAHEATDKLYVVLEGCGIFRVGDDVREVGEKNAVWAPAGATHGVKNDGAAPLVLLVVMAPRPDHGRKAR